MFLGHFALGFAAKKVEPSLSLGTALVAAQLPDVIWPCFVLLEQLAATSPTTLGCGGVVVGPPLARGKLHRLLLESADAVSEL